MSLLVSDVINDLSILTSTPPDSDRLYRYINEAQRRIFLEGLYKGTYGFCQFCIYGQCITLPPEVDCILKGAILSTPISVRNQWFEFMDAGPGFQDPSSNYCYGDFYDRGEGFCTIQEPTGPFTISIYTDVPEDPNALAIIQGCDIYSRPIATEITPSTVNGPSGMEWLAGVQQPIWSAVSYPTTTLQVFSSVIALNLPVRNSTIRLYANLYAADGTTPLLNADGSQQQLLLGIYPYWLTNPNFRRYNYPPGFNSQFVPQIVRALVRRKPIPVSKPTDYLLISNIPALKNMVMSIVKEESEDYQGRDQLRLEAKRLLEQEAKLNQLWAPQLNIQWRGFSNFPWQPGGVY